MLEQIYQWIKNIAFYLILITAVMNVLPNNSYKKYVRLFTGMVLVLLVLSPLTGFLNLNQLMDVTYVTNSFKQELGDLDVQTDDFEKLQEDKLFEAYEQEIADEIADVVEEEGLYALEVKVRMNRDRASKDYGSISGVDIKATYSKRKSDDIYIEPVMIGESGQKMEVDSMEEINIKNELERFYNISAANINISIQR